MIASVILDEGRVGSLIEVDCETDFVAKNEEFKMFVKNLAEKAALTEVNFAESVRDEVIAKIAQIGENIVVRRTVRYVLQDNGLIASYIHNGNTIGVLVEIGCQKSESTATPVFKELAKDICLHIAASNPQCIDREHVSAELIASERDIYAKQASDKPAHIVDKIVDGKMNKFFEHICLINQAFVKDQDKTIIALLKEKDSELNESLHIRRFARFQVGETS